MEITQKHASNKIRFVFHDDRSDHAWQDSSRSRSFSVPYTEISRDRQTLTERQAWFRNAGLIWMLIGSVWVFASWSEHRLAEDGSGSSSARLPMRSIASGPHQNLHPHVKQAVPGERLLH